MSGDRRIVSNATPPGPVQGKLLTSCKALSALMLLLAESLTGIDLSDSTLEHREQELEEAL